MPIPSFSPGYPLDGSSLGSSKVAIRGNIDGTFQTLNIDHDSANDANPGYHKDIHMIPQAGDPAAIPGFGQLYVKTINDVTIDQALFFESGNGIISQLTNNFTPSEPAPNNGYSYLPGGFIIQWGVVVGSSSPPNNTQVTFVPNNIDFTTALYNVQVVGAASGNIYPSTFATTGFRINGTTPLANYYWLAIGK